MIPPQFASCPFDVSDKELLSTQPWVNMIHTWEKVLNLMNRISASQRAEPKETHEDLVNMGCSISIQLFELTVESDGDTFSRKSKSFQDGVPFEETKQREAGCKEVNAMRHVCLGEMGYILGTIEEVYKRQIRNILESPFVFVVSVRLPIHSLYV